MGQAVLKCEDVTVAFGSFIAVNRVNLTIEEGRLYSVIGPNGAGKTTLINALSGLQKVKTGRIFLKGEEITHLDAHVRAQKGMGRSFQIVNIFPEMSVFENLRLAGQAARFGLQPFWRPVADYGDLNEAAEDMLEFISLPGHRDVTASLLSHGDQRRLEIGISLMTDPTVVLFDEPLAGIGHHEMGPTVELIGKAARDRTVLLIEHNMDVVMSISDRIVVLVNGTVLCCDSPAKVRGDQRVRDVYLGEDEEDDAFPR